MGAVESTDVPIITFGVWLFCFSKVGLAIRGDDAPVRFTDGRCFCSIHSNNQIFLNARDGSGKPRLGRPVSGSVNAVGRCIA